MTCEVAVLNKYAVVIAADSAVTYTNGTQDEPRYSKGGNKIFQLSHHYPIGVMIYDSGSMLGIPWELVIKAFRNHLDKTQFDTVEEYADHFLSFLRTNQTFFPQSERDDDYLSAIGRGLIVLLSEAVERNPILQDSTASRNDREAAWLAFAAAQTTKFNGMGNLAGLTAGLLTASEQLALASHLHGEAQTAVDDLATEGDAYVNDFINIDDWIRLAVLQSFKLFNSYPRATGIVFAGYGETQFFPQLAERKISAFIGNEVVWKAGDTLTVTRDKESHISQFATTSMVDVFTKGYGFQIFKAVQESFAKAASSLVDAVIQAAGAPAPANVDALKKQARTTFSKAWTSELYKGNFLKIQRAIGTLPIDEMVHLAETMIVLESLKEKVTSPSQSVGGPVDVAVITREEGLVWVKRKQFFDSTKNPRFMQRQEQIYR